MSQLTRRTFVKASLAADLAAKEYRKPFVLPG